MPLMDVEIKHADGSVERTKAHVNPRRNLSSQPDQLEVDSSLTEREVDLIPRILYGSAAVLFLMVAFPPFSFKGEYGRGLFAGYHFIFNPSVRATVDVAVLIAQAFFVLLIAALLIAVEIYKRKRKMLKP